MTELTSVTLENEMDIIVAHKRMIKASEALSLTLSTQSTLATAVAEVTREVIDKTNTGVLSIGLEKEGTKYFITARINFSEPIRISLSDEGMAYARKLVPEFNYENSEQGGNVVLRLGIPRSTKLTNEKIQIVKEQFIQSKANSPYEEVKEKYSLLHKQSRVQEEELKRSQYLDEKKTEFISIASHELKTPLTSIRAYAQLALSANGECSDNVKGFLRKINLAADKLNTLIVQLMDVSKMETGKLEYNFEEVNADYYFRESLQMLQHILPNHHIEANFNTEGSIMIDKIRMEQVMGNLIGNAAKYSESGTSIKVSFDKTDKDELQITIADQGIGMDYATLQNIFTKFYRAEGVTRKYSGLGMGLYIASRIIAEHGGTLRAESEINKGSSFFFTLPFTPSSAISKQRVSADAIL